MQEVDSRNQNFLGGMPPNPLEGRAYGAWGAFGIRRAYGTLSPPLYKSLDPPLNTIVFCNSNETWAKVESKLDQFVANVCGKDLEEAARKHAGGYVPQRSQKSNKKEVPKECSKFDKQSS